MGSEMCIRDRSNGIPEGSGVALGLDRLLMIMGELEHIDSVQSFSIKRV